MKNFNNLLVHHYFDEDYNSIDHKLKKKITLNSELNLHILTNNWLTDTKLLLSNLNI